MEKESFESRINEQLANHELPVNQALWKSVSSQAGLSAGGFGLGLGAWIGLIGAVVVISAGIFIYSNTSSSSTKSVTKPQPKELTTTSTQENTETNHAKQSISTDKKTINQNKIDAKQESTAVLDEPEQLAPTQPIKLAQNEHQEIPTISPKKPNKISQQGLPNSQNQANPVVAPTKTQKTIAMPNVITPNGDGVNDGLSLEIEGLTDFNIVILDATNRVVYSSTDPLFKWDGTLPNGDAAPSGMYQYYFTAKDDEGKWKNQFSALSIIR